MNRQVTRNHALPAAALLVMTLASGCASKGYVNDRIDELRLADERHEAQLARLENSTQDALERARMAGDSAGEARDLALGKAGFEEITRFTVYFAFDSDALRDTEQGTLRQATEQIRSHPEAIVDVYGFADPAGSDRYNLELGRRRAMEVVRELAAATPSQLSRYAAVSFGERELGGMESQGAEEKSRRAVISLIRRIPMEGAAPSTASLPVGS